MKPNAKANKKKDNHSEHSSTHFGDHECLDSPRMGNVRSEAKIYHWSAAIHRCRGSIRNFGLKEVDLVLVILF